MHRVPEAFGSVRKKVGHSLCIERSIAAKMYEYELQDKDTEHQKCAIRNVL